RPRLQPLSSPERELRHCHPVPVAASASEWSDFRSALFASSRLRVKSPHSSPPHWSLVIRHWSFLRMSVLAQLPRTKLTGICPPARGAAIAELTRGHPSPVWLIIAEELKLAEQLAEDVAFFHRSAGGNPAALETLVFPESMPDSRDMREAFAASADRTTVLSRLRSATQFSHSRSLPSAPLPQVSGLNLQVSSAQLVVVTTPAALLQPVPALAEF